MKTDTARSSNLSRDEADRAKERLETEGIEAALVRVQR